MGHPGFNRQWARADESERRNHRGRGSAPWGDWNAAGWSGRQGPPPWVAGLFGLGQGEQRRGPRVRRGDVRSAILDVVGAASERDETVNGYQVIAQIGERSGGEWRPSPGSVYPTIQLLHDEGLLETDDDHGRKSLRLTAAGTTYVAEHAEELAAVWAPFEREQRAEKSAGFGDLKPEIGQVMGAVWQIITTGSQAQQRAAVEVLIDTRKRLYGILADGDEGLTEDGESDVEEPADS